jgi:putative endonuclease
MDHQYWTYIVVSLSGTPYIGMTNHIERRIREYKNGIFEGFARDCSAGVSPAVQGFDQVLDAIAREKQLKGWRQSEKIALIQSRNPQWQNLAEKWGWQMAFPGESITGR